MPLITPHYRNCNNEQDNKNRIVIPLDALKETLLIREFIEHVLLWLFIFHN